LGTSFPAIGENIELAILVIIFVSLLPVGIEFLRHRRNSKPKGKYAA
jgi:membrane-associated protein